ncbi:MAG TPA: hypothetical protein VGD91_02365 [Trebonia sp.]
MNVRHHRSGLTVAERVSTMLACAAVDPRLSGVLLLDLDPVLLFPLAKWLADLIGGPRGENQPPVLGLSGRYTEESLWGRYVPTRDHHEPLRWKNGVLDSHESRPGIVIVPDLTRLSLPAARAAVTLVGAEVAHLARGPEPRIWHPRDRWLAGLSREDAGTVSPHLLDRFSVRVDATGLAGGWPGQPALPQPSLQWRHAVQAGRAGERPEFPGSAAERVEALVSARAPGVRRDLALARTARALAALAGEAVTSTGYVDRAAEFLGLWPNAAAATSPPAVYVPSHAITVPTVVTAPRPAWPEPAGTGQAGDGTRLETGHGAGPEDGKAKAGTGKAQAAAGAAKEFPPTPASGTEGPATRTNGWPSLAAAQYPEDDAAPRRVSDPLRSGWQRGKSGPARGYPVGTERARDLSDIAVLPTFLEALPHQAKRCPSRRTCEHGLHVYPEDLRSYRRAPWTGHLLVLVLDHSSRALDWDWLEPLTPYLSWAYITRAQVGVVQVGAARADGGPAGELRASEFRGKNLLDPRVEAALEPRPGRATPLAHGLTLAAAILRHDTQQGGAPVTEARLVVVTDGRANVPLSNSQSGLPPVNVGRRAVDDAELAAKAIRGLHRVQSVVIDPGPEANRHLATRLAVALAAPLTSGLADPPAAPEGAA